MLTNVIRWALAGAMGYWIFHGSVAPLVIMWTLVFLDSEAGIYLRNRGKR